MNRWTPNGCRSHYGPPPVGVLIAREHAVWKVSAVVDIALTDEDRDVWLADQMPDLATWRGRPYKTHLDHVGGARPSWADADGPVPGASLTTRAERFSAGPWHVYPDSERWPMCSCCGEPMPCRAEIQDQMVAAGLARVEKLAARMPGCCWACNEPITSRQKVVTYEGDNMDLPGGLPVRFHARASCRYQASQYELRWIAVDPRRERILTWPKCGGCLVVHADGSSECRSGPGPFGPDMNSEPNCVGHLSHDHAYHQACYVGDAWFEHPSRMLGCPRGCSQENHPGTRTTRRPERATYAAPTLLP